MLKSWNWKSPLHLPQIKHILNFTGRRGHDEDASSTSEDEGYPDDMDQDKHDDTTDDSDSERSDADSEGEEFMHHDDGAEREGGEDKKSGKLRKKRFGTELTNRKLVNIALITSMSIGLGRKYSILELKTK